MTQKLGRFLLGLGILSTAGLLTWGWGQGFFSFGDKGVAIGIDRAFFFFVYLPMTALISVSGVVLSYSKKVRKVWFRRIFFVTSLLVFLVAVNFILVNIKVNIRYYGGEDMLRVLILDLIFATPLLFLSGMLFYFGILRRTNKSEL